MLYELHDRILERCPLLLPLFRKLTIEIHCERTNQRSCDFHVEPPVKVHVLEIQQDGRSSTNGSSSGSNAYGNSKGDVQESSGLDKIIGLGQGQGLGQRLARKHGYTPSTYAQSSSLSSTKKSSSASTSTAAYVNLSTTSDTPKARVTPAAVALSTISSGNNNSSTSFSRRSSLLQQEWQT